MKNLPLKRVRMDWVVLYELSTLKDYKGATVSWLISEMFWSWSLSLGWQKIGISILGKGHAPKIFLALGQVIWPSRIDPSIYLCLKWLFWRQLLSAWLTGSTVSSGIRCLCPRVFCLKITPAKWEEDTAWHAYEMQTAFPFIRLPKYVLSYSAFCWAFHVHL